jgi:hypothetical protein
MSEAASGIATAETPICSAALAAIMESIFMAFSFLVSSFCKSRKGKKASRECDGLRKPTKG